MAIVDRIKNILLSPKEEWPKIAGETATVQSLYTGYIMILGAIGPLAMLIASMAYGGATGAIVSYLGTLIMVYVVALIADLLAPTFGGQKNMLQSLQLVAYSCTAVWLAGILQLLGMLAGILSLIALIYSLYTFYLGVTVMKKVPQEKAVTYTVVVVLCVMVLGAVIGFLLRTTLYSGMPMGM